MEFLLIFFYDAAFFRSTKYVISWEFFFLVLIKLVSKKIKNFDVKNNP